MRFEISDKNAPSGAKRRVNRATCVVRRAGSTLAAFTGWTMNGQYQHVCSCASTATVAAAAAAAAVGDVIPVVSVVRLCFNASSSHGPSSFSLFTTSSLTSSSSWSEVTSSAIVSSPSPSSSSSSSPYLHAPAAVKGHFKSN